MAKVNICHCPRTFVIVTEVNAFRAICSAASAVMTLDVTHTPALIAPPTYGTQGHLVDVERLKRLQAVPVERVTAATKSHSLNGLPAFAGRVQRYVIHADRTLSVPSALSQCQKRSPIYLGGWAWLRRVCSRASAVVLQGVRWSKYPEWRRRGSDRYKPQQQEQTEPLTERSSMWRLVLSKCVLGDNVRLHSRGGHQCKRLVKQMQRGWWPYRL